MSAPLPFVDLKAQYTRLKPVIAARIQRVLDHGQYVLGPEVAELEEALARFCGARHCVTVASGTEALRLPLMAAGIGPGDAVLLPAFTFPATAEVVVALGATPIFVDVDPRTCNLDPGHLAEILGRARKGTGPQPKAVMPVDLFGLPADYAAIEAIAEADGLIVLADAAQSFGARLGNRAVGTLAPVTATSFFPAKPLGAYGEGGAIFTDSAERAHVLRSIRAHGAGDDRYDIVRLGTNARLDTLQAAVLLAKLEVFADELVSRERWAALYDSRLGSGIAIPYRSPDSRSAWAQYCVRVPHRDQVRERLAREGIPTAIYYPKPLHFQPAYSCYGDGPGSLPVSERLCGEILALPMHPYLDETVIDRIAKALRGATGRI
jgi:dTDP-4-amino-4,6-dideoxygalactose transaminase